MVFDWIDRVFAGLGLALRFLLGLDAGPYLILIWWAWIVVIAAAVISASN